jgi:hypothetical protein
MQDINHKVSSIGSTTASLERATSNFRNEMSELAAKVDSVSLELKDMEGAINVQKSCRRRT